MRATSKGIGLGDLHHPRRRELGQDLVEMALLLPLLLALTFGIIDFGRVIFSYSTIANAAREGARFAVTDPTNTAGIQDTTQHLLTAGLQCDPPPVPTVTSTKRITITLVTVGMNCNVPLITGWIPQVILGGTGTIPLHAESTMQVE